MILTNENYFSPEAQMEYMGVSQYKDFLDCPARALATVKGEYEPEQTTAMKVGSFVDAYFEGTLAEFKLAHPEMFNIKLVENDETRAKVAEVMPELLTGTGNWKSGALTKAREAHPEFFTLQMELKADFTQAEEIIARIESDDGLMEHLSGEKQVIITATLFKGTPAESEWKIKIDSYHPGKQIDDLKIMRSLERIMGISFVQHWGYDTQMAVYSEVEALSTGGDRLETYLDVATKEDPADVAIVHIPAWRRKECLTEVEKHMPRILAYKRGDLEAPGCGVCPYCRGKKKARVIEFDEVGFSNKELAAMNGKAF